MARPAPGLENIFKSFPNFSIKLAFVSFDVGLNPGINRSISGTKAAATGDPGKKNSTGNESINISANALFDKYTEYDSTTT